MNKYTINYRFLFKDLEFPFTSKLLFEEKEPIVYTEYTYNNLEGKYIIHFPKINIMKLDGNFDDRREYIDKLKEEYEKTGENIYLEYNYDFIQEISVIINTKEEIELEFNDRFKKNISDNVANHLNTYLSMLKQELFLWEWQLPKFEGSDTGGITTKNKLFEYLDSVSYYKNSELIFEPFGFNIKFSNNAERFSNLDESLEKIRKQFQSGEHEILKEKEVIGLAFYEMESGNFDVAILLAAMAIEIPVKNLVNKYFDRNKVARIIDDMRKNPKTREKPTVIKYLTVLINKYPFIYGLKIDLEKIETLFKTRNKVVHEGEPYYCSRDGQTKVQVSYKEANNFMKLAKDFIEIKIPEIKEKIENKKAFN
ncbi:MAG: hypothetical protein A2104_01955 [Candidatus Melainabacteria bacterium GWF2_32_7]|nr:MAG: hypothetical protein A2104_01955 [Candidatus Melainabacteria bacterium GWF2_32_7]